MPVSPERGRGGWIGEGRREFSRFSQKKNKLNNGTVRCRVGRRYTPAC